MSLRGYPTRTCSEKPGEGSHLKEGINSLSNDAEGQTFCQRVVEAASIRPDKVAMLLIESKAAQPITFGSMLAQIRICGPSRMTATSKMFSRSKAK